MRLNDNKKCIVKDCERDVRAKGLCGMHHQQMKRLGRLGELESRVDHSNKEIVIHSKYYTETIISPVQCGYNNCDEMAVATGFCEFHYNGYISGWKEGWSDNQVVSR